jgi:hypothetical protein
VAGGEWSTSDYGNGVHSFRAYAIRVVCLLCRARHKIHYAERSVMPSCASVRSCWLGDPRSSPRLPRSINGEAAEADNSRFSGDVTSWRAPPPRRARRPPWRRGARMR